MRLEIRVKPSCKKPGIEKVTETSWIIKVREAPVDGKANDAVIQAISRELKVPPSFITLIRGATGRTKLFEITEK
jgi:uncharacterized protein YggU (UPF0235/DUF167 family)